MDDNAPPAPERTYVLGVDDQLVRIQASALSPTTRLALNDTIRVARRLLAEDVVTKG